MREIKLTSGVNFQWALKQACVKQMGRKRGAGLILKGSKLQNILLLHRQELT
jgi:hypothetical protein